MEIWIKGLRRAVKRPDKWRPPWNWWRHSPARIGPRRSALHTGNSSSTDSRDGPGCPGCRWRWYGWWAPSSHGTASPRCPFRSQTCECPRSDCGPRAWRRDRSQLPTKPPVEKLTKKDSKNAVYWISFLLNEIIRDIQFITAFFYGIASDDAVVFLLTFRLELKSLF